MNELEMKGLKVAIKEILEDETDITTRLDDLEESVRDLEGKQPEEPDEELPDEEDIDEPKYEREPNPARPVYEEDLNKVKEKKSGTRLTKEAMQKIANPPTKTISREPVGTKKETGIEDFEKEFNETIDDKEE